MPAQTVALAVAAAQPKGTERCEACLLVAAEGWRACCEAPPVRPRSRNSLRREVSLLTRSNGVVLCGATRTVRQSRIARHTPLKPRSHSPHAAASAAEPRPRANAMQVVGQTCTRAGHERELRDTLAVEPVPAAAAAAPRAPSSASKTTAKHTGSRSVQDDGEPARGGAADTNPPRNAARAATHTQPHKHRRHHASRTQTARSRGNHTRRQKEGAERTISFRGGHKSQRAAA